MANDFLSTMKVYLNKLNDGEKTPAEVASALNSWVRESSESIKARVEEEVQSTVAKMGFIKREEFEALAKEVNDLKRVHSVSGKVGASSSRKTTAKKAAKKAVKKVAKKAVKKVSKSSTKKSTVAKKGIKR